VVAIGTTEDRPGGAANVASNVAALDASCRLLSVVGDDENGAQLAELLAATRIDSRLHRDTSSSTTVKLRVLARNQQLIRLDLEAPPGHEILASCLEDFRKSLEEADVVIISDYGKGGLAHIEEMIALAQARSVPVIVDPKGRDFSRYRGASLITPNRREFEEMAGECPDENTLIQRAHALVTDLELEGLLLTRSEKGMTLFLRDGAVVHSDASAREVYDVTGAGDTVIAVYAVARTAGITDQDALTLANAAAGIVVGRLGTASVTRAELEKVLGQSAG
jgi:rfaE bifunctional protein kinase chain/domain